MIRRYAYWLRALLMLADGLLAAARCSWRLRRCASASDWAV